MTELEDQGLPLTALAVAAGRAVEASRADPLVADPFAAALVEAARSHVDLPTVWPAEPEAALPRQQPATWVLEGLLPYLDAAAQLAVLEELAALSASGSRVVIERAVPLPKTDDVEAKLRDFSLQTGLSISELLARADPPNPVELLEFAGWRCSEHTVQELCSTYGRSLSLTACTEPREPGPEPTGDSGQSRGGFVTAWRP
jgi:O-methyltransferase involved in polyketide biosynthesis